VAQWAAASAPGDGVRAAGDWKRQEGAAPGADSIVSESRTNRLRILREQAAAVLGPPVAVEHSIRPWSPMGRWAQAQRRLRRLVTEMMAVRALKDAANRTKSTSENEHGGDEPGSATETKASPLRIPPAVSREASLRRASQDVPALRPLSSSAALMAEAMTNADSLGFVGAAGGGGSSHGHGHGGSSSSGMLLMSDSDDHREQRRRGSGSQSPFSVGSMHMHRLGGGDAPQLARRPSMLRRSSLTSSAPAGHGRTGGSPSPAISPVLTSSVGRPDDPDDVLGEFDESGV